MGKSNEWGWSSRDAVLKRGVCPECNGKLIELLPIPDRGDGYTSIKGCKRCKRVFYIDINSD